MGRLENKIINTGIDEFTTSFEYEAGAAANSTTTRVQEINNNGDNITYTYDSNGNIETITEDGKVIKYYYNELNEVLREDNKVIDKTIVYTYDVGGNILNKTEYLYTTGTLGDPTSTISYGYTDSNWKDKLTSYDGKAITYDAIGNPLSYDGWTFAWEKGRHKQRTQIFDLV